MNLTVSDVSALLKVPEKQIYRWIDEGELACHWFHNQPRFNRTVLLEWATAHRVPIALDQFLDDEEGEVAVPGFAASLAAGGIYRGIGGTDRAAVLQQVVAVLPIPAMEKETLVEVLRAQETAGSTGIGGGIAIPHARQPIILGGVPAFIALCFLAHPVDFAAVDGEPVHTLFVMVGTTVRGHLQSLAQLALALRNPRFRDAVLRREDDGAILAAAAMVEATFHPPVR
jgi:PTS system nitrogen regulatory IIA component